MPDWNNVLLALCNDYAFMFLLTEYQPSTEGGTRSPPGGPKMVDGVWKGVNPLVFGSSKQLLLNKFLIRALLLWEKVVMDKREKIWKKRGGKRGEKEKEEESSSH